MPFGFGRQNQVETTDDSTKPSHDGRERQGLLDIVPTSSEWFRTMLRSFLLTYASLLGAIAAWFKGPGVVRLLAIAAISLPHLQRLVTRPSIRRVVRGSLRNRQSLVRAAAPLVLGSAVLTLAIVIPDALQGRNTIDRHLGPVDQVVLTDSIDTRLAALTAIDRFKQNQDLDRRTGTQSLETLGAQLNFATTKATAWSTTATNVAVDVVELDAPDVAIVGFPSDPPEQQADLSADAARVLNAKAGDTVSVRAGGTIAQLTIRDVLAADGFGAFAPDASQHPITVFARSGSLSTTGPQSGAQTRFGIAFVNTDRSWKQARNVAGKLSIAVADLAPQTDGTAPQVDVLATSSMVRDRLRSDVDRIRPAVSLACGMIGLLGFSLLWATARFEIRRRRATVESLRSSGETRRDAIGAITARNAVLALPAGLFGATLGHGFARSAVLVGEFRPSRVAVISGLVASFIAVSSAELFGVPERSETNVFARLQHSIRSIGPAFGAPLAAIAAAAVLVVAHGNSDSAVFRVALGATAITLGLFAAHWLKHLTPAVHAVGTWALFVVCLFGLLSRTRHTVPSLVGLSLLCVASGTAAVHSLTSTNLLPVRFRVSLPSGWTASFLTAAASCAVLVASAMSRASTDDHAGSVMSRIVMSAFMAVVVGLLVLVGLIQQSNTDQQRTLSTMGASPDDIAKRLTHQLGPAVVGGALVGLLVAAAASHSAIDLGFTGNASPSHPYLWWPVLFLATPVALLAFVRWLSPRIRPSGKALK